jgi:AcrR family transcriptional regulator
MFDSGYGISGLSTGRARELRVTKKLSLNEIAERLALPKTTVYYWIADLPLERPKRWTVGQERAARANKEKHLQLGKAAYERGLGEYEELVRLPTFRDFVTLYIAEG